MSTSADSPMLTRDPRNAKLRVFAPPHEIAPDVFMHAAFVNTYALRTAAGLVLIDPGLGAMSSSVHDAVRAWSSEPLHTVIYTHGHFDHAFGLGAFLQAGERPEIVAQRRVLDRFERYRLTRGLQEQINSRQFGGSVRFPEHFHPPTKTFDDQLELDVGGEALRLVAEKGETDDACIVWLPRQKFLFCGDLVIWALPNCGNPQKVQRFPVDWADALERMAGLGAQWLFPGHGLAVAGAEAIHTLLSDTARVLRHLIEQVLTRMNRGESPDAIFEAVEADAELMALPYLRASYDHPKFIVKNLLRLWGGWWGGEPAELLPAARADRAREIAELAGGAARLVERGRERLSEGRLELAAHLSDWAFQAAPTDRATLELRRDVYAACLSQASSLMAQGIYRDALNQARAALGEPPVAVDLRGALRGQ